MKFPLGSTKARSLKFWSGLNRKNRLTMGILAGGVAIVLLMLASAPQHDPSIVAEQIWPISAMVVEPESVSPQLKLFGKIESPNHAQLTAAVTATISQVHVVEGETVSAGDILVVLDDADESLRLQQRNADLVEAQSKLQQTARRQEAELAVLKHMLELHHLTTAKAERLATLAKRNLVATEQLENTQQEVARQAIQLAQQQMTVDNHPHSLAVAASGVQRSAAQYAEQELRLQRTRIRAPFDGRVSRVEVAVGDRIMEGQGAIHIYDLTSLRVRAVIPSAIAASLRRALSSGAQIQARIVSGTQFIELNLDQLAAQVKQGRSGIDGLFTLDQSGSFLELGRAVDMTVFMPVLDDVVALPIQSLYGNNRVYTITQGRLKGVAVATVGQRLDQMGNFQTLVRSPDLLPGSQVLTTTLPRATSGLRVQVIQEEEVVGQGDNQKVLADSA